MTDERIIEIYKDAILILEDEFDVEASLYENYSGRGMYGTTTVGIVLNSSQASMIGVAVARALNDSEFKDDFNLSEIVPKRSDNMGLDMIYYL